MPEPPDFDQIARRIIDMADTEVSTLNGSIMVENIAEQLRQVWNARGEALQPRCASCRHWDGAPTSTIGVCAGVRGPIGLALVADVPAVVTTYDFGCVQWEQK